MPSVVRLRTALAFVAGGLAVAPTSASAAPSLKLVARPSGGAVRVDVRAPRDAGGVALFLDGRRVATDRHAPFRFARVRTRQLRRGNHHLEAVARAGGVTVFGLKTLAVSHRGARTLAGGVRVRLGGIANGQEVRGARLHLRATPSGAGRGIMSVEFWIDGRRRSADASAPYGFDWSTRRLRRGSSHTVAAVVYDRGGAVAVSPTTVINVPGLHAAGGNRSWTADFESRSFSDWTWWQRPEFTANEFGVVAAGTDGVPAHSGSRLAKFVTTRAQVDGGMKHAKLYKEWAVASPETGWDDDASRPLGSMAGTKDASGTYSAWYFVPTDVQWTHDWSNIFQFKLVFPNPGGTSVGSQPQWWVDLMSADAWSGMPGVQRPRRADGSLPGDKDPVLVASNWTMKRADGSEPDWNARMVAPPVGRWFKISARIVQGHYVQFSLDDKPWFTGTSSEWPAGIGTTPTHRANDISGFIFGTGLYGGPGRLYVDDAGYSPAS